DVSTGRVRKEFHGFQGRYVADAAFAPDGKTLVTIEGDASPPFRTGWVKLWDASTLQERSGWEAHPNGGPGAWPLPWTARPWSRAAMMVVCGCGTQRPDRERRCSTGRESVRPSPLPPTAGQCSRSLMWMAI